MREVKSKYFDSIFKTMHRKYIKSFLICGLFKHLAFLYRILRYLFFHSGADLRPRVYFRLLIETCPYGLERRHPLCLLESFYHRTGADLRLFRGLLDFPETEGELMGIIRLQQGHFVHFRGIYLQQEMRFYHQNQRIEQGYLLAKGEG